MLLPLLLLALVGQAAAPPVDLTVTRTRDSSLTITATPVAGRTVRSLSIDDTQKATSVERLAKGALRATFDRRLALMHVVRVRFSDGTEWRTELRGELEPVHGYKGDPPKLAPPRGY